MARHDRRTTIAVLASCLIASACQSVPSPPPDGEASHAPTGVPTASPSPPPILNAIGPGEGRLDILVRPGYAEEGANDDAYDWVTPFEQDTGCAVNATEMGTPEEMLTRLATDGPGAWDGLSASGVISRGLIAEAAVQPIDVGLFSAWHDLWPPLQASGFDTVDAVHYGLAQGWAADLLMWNTQRVATLPATWQTIYDPETAVPGGVTAYDSPITMADAALYLASRDPELGIVDPYELTAAQFDAVVTLLQAQRPLVTTYWGTPVDQIGAFEAGDAVIGAAWPGSVRYLQAEDPPVPVDVVAPAEGITAAADTWMVLVGARHPNCMLRWMAWMLGPQVQKQVAEYVGQAPANVAACEPLTDHPGPFGFEEFCAFHHATDGTLVARLHFWRTPLADCGASAGGSCVGYDAWRQQWDEIKAAG